MHVGADKRGSKPGNRNRCQTIGVIMSLQADGVILRAEKAAQTLKVESQKLLEVLEDVGITDDPDGFSVLNSPAVTADDLTDILVTHLGAKKLLAKVAASLLKNPEGSTVELDKVEVVKPQPNYVSDIASLLKSNRPIEQWDDRALLDEFIKTRSHESELELDKRAKHQKFVVLLPGKFEPGKEQVDVEATLVLLKMARKKTVPSVIPNGDVFSVVYRVTELNPEDRITEICPICGESLYQGYCEKCQLSFAGVGDDERAYVRMVADSSTFEKKSLSDRRAIHASATKGLEDLKMTWPSLAQHFDELKLTNSLPRLRVIENRPSTRVSDPFFVNGQRSFGNRSF
jgi:hypothetical protein